MKRIFTILMTVLAITLPAVAQSGGDKGRVQQQQQDKKEEMSRTTSQIEDNRQEMARQLRALNSLEADIAQQQQLIGRLSAQLDSINRASKAVNDSIDGINRRLEELRNSYGNAVRRMHSHSSAFDRLLFVFSASSLHEAYRRMRYMGQFKQWREHNVADIEEQMQLLEAKKSSLDRLKERHTQNLNAQQRAKLDLEGQKKKQDEAVANLRKQGRLLQATLDQQRKEAEELDCMLEDMIREEERLAEERRKAEEAERRRKAQEEDEARRRAAQEEAERTAQQEPPTVTDEVEKPTTPAKEPEPTPEPSKSPSWAADAPKLPDAERSFSGSFASNKGKILFPVTGSYKIVRKFGINEHPTVRRLKYNNTGIDIEVKQGTVVRNVFNGTVTGVSKMKNGHMAVIVSHGNDYRTIYSELNTVYVGYGDKIRANEAIGVPYSDPLDENRTILHFEVRKGLTELDPMQWVK